MEKWGPKKAQAMSLDRVCPVEPGIFARVLSSTNYTKLVLTLQREFSQDLLERLYQDSRKVHGIDVRFCFNDLNLRSEVLSEFFNKDPV